MAVLNAAVGYKLKSNSTRNIAALQTACTTLMATREVAAAMNAFFKHYLPGVPVPRRVNERVQRALTKITELA